MNPTFSDSDDRQEHKLSLKSRQANVFGNLESDSLNENFSPARYERFKRLNKKQIERHISFICYQTEYEKKTKIQTNGS